MSRVAADTDWLRRMGALTVEPDGTWPHDQTRAAHQLVVRLVTTARPVAASASAAAACPPAAAALIHELSAVDVPREPEDGAHDPGGLAAAYVGALRQAAGAVYFCRRIEHASGRCWFSVRGPSADLCGRVLAASHHCATSH